MNIRITAAVFAACSALAGCSTPAPEQIGQMGPIPEPEISIDLPLEDPAPGHPDILARVCKLGASCLELDPRPFEACLVGTKHCVDKALEPVEVKAPDVPSEPGVVETAAGRGD